MFSSMYIFLQFTLSDGRRLANDIVKSDVVNFFDILICEETANKEVVRRLVKNML